MIKRVALFVVLLLQFHVVTAHTQIAQQTESRKTSSPYTGDLSIFDSPGRDERLQINRVMDMLAIAPGKTVADIGAGSGWFTVRAARRIGEAGTVYAVDINPRPSVTSSLESGKRTCTTSNLSWANPMIRSYPRKLTPCFC